MSFDDAELEMHILIHVIQLLIELNLKTIFNGKFDKWKELHLLKFKNDCNDVGVQYPYYSHSRSQKVKNITQLGLKQLEGMNSRSVKSSFIIKYIIIKWRTTDALVTQ